MTICICDSKGSNASGTHGHGRRLVGATTQVYLLENRKSLYNSSSCFLHKAKTSVNSHITTNKDVT